MTKLCVCACALRGNDKLLAWTINICYIEWLQTAPLNPNDPRNGDLIRLENLAIANAQLDFFKWVASHARVCCVCM